MNNTLTIRLKKDNDAGTHSIDAGYEVRVNGEMRKRYLNDRLEVVEVSPKSDKGQKYDITLNSQNLWVKVIQLSGEGIDVAKIKQWAKEHPLLSKDGETSHALYSFAFNDEVVEETYEDDEEITEVRTKFGTLTDEEAQAVSVNFGYAPWGIDEKVLKNTLVGLKGGIITHNPAYRSEFLNSFDRIMDEHKLNFKSGVQCQVINLTADGVYTYNGEVLGSSEEQGILMLKQRKDLYSAISRDLTGKGKFFAPRAKVQEIKEQVKQEKELNELEEDFDNMDIATEGKVDRRRKKAETV